MPVDDSALLETLAPYVPATLLRQALAGALPEPGVPVFIEAAALFADFSGFTPMTERLAGHGRVGAEALTRLLNGIFTPLITLIWERGGDVAHFSGDALIAFFARAPRHRRASVARAALDCSLAMQRVMREQFASVTALGEQFPLQMKIGVGFGPAVTLNVGLSEDGLYREFVLAGPALEHAVAAEDRAHVGEVLYHWPALPLAARECSLVERRDEFAVMGAVHAPARAVAPPEAGVRALDPDRRARLLAALRPYLPGHIVKELAEGQSDDALASLRSVTSLSVDFRGLDYMDPAHGPLLQAYIAGTQRTVQRYGGHLNRVLVGDKGSQLHIFFGAPTSYEDHVARALHCALALQAETPAFVSSQRIGIATGPVFAAPVGSPQRREYTVMGDAVNLSFRLVMACESGEILVDAATQARDAQARFIFQSLGALHVKGKAAPVEIARLQAERVAGSQFISHYLISRGHRPVGRAEELAVIVQVSAAALAGRAQELAICGPAGVGKSRLVEEVVQAWMRAGPHVLGFGGDCQSHLGDTPYVPWRNLLRGFFNLQEDDGPDESRQKIENLVNELCPQWREWAALPGDLAGVDLPESAVLRGFDERQRRARLHEVVVDLLLARAARAPLLLLFEDVHWADGPSLELLDALAAALARAPQYAVLVCLAFRPGAPVEQAALLRAAACTRIDLSDLPTEDGEALVRELLGAIEPARAAERLVALVVRRTQAEGRCNPLFIEEFIHSLFDTGLLVETGAGCRIALDDPDDIDRVELQVPGTLEGLLLARIDRLSTPNRNLLQVASVVGREFTYPEVRSAYAPPVARDELIERMRLLDEADFTRLAQLEPELAYLFRHALTHEVTYGSLPFARRAELHGRIGAFLETAYADRPEAVCAQLAHHFARASLADKALTYALLAGEQAHGLYALREALHFYDQAEEHLAQGDLAAGRWRDALRLALDRADTLRLLGHPERARADAERALALAREHGDQDAEVRALILLAMLCSWQQRMAEFMLAADEAVQLAERYGYVQRLPAALRWRGEAYRAAGDVEAARVDFERGASLAREQGNRQDLGQLVQAQARLAFSHNRFDEALIALEQALALHREAGARPAAAAALSNISLVQLRRGYPAEALAASTQAIAVAEAAGANDRVPYFIDGLGEAQCVLGDYAQAESVFHRALDLFEQMKDENGRGYVQLRLGRECLLDQGRRAEAETVLRESLALAQRADDRENVVQALAALGQCRWEAGDAAGAYATWDEAAALCTTPDLAWWAPELCVRRARALLAAGELERARAEAERAVQAIQTLGGCPDWAGPAWLVQALAAERLAHDPLGDSRPRELFERAVAGARRRSRRIELARCLHAAGRYFAANADPGLHAQGVEWQAEAEGYFREMNVPET
jgi:class 3 adenylate cyclase/tetratricopeptide (TPR) repeat protein